MTADSRTQLRQRLSAANRQIELLERRLANKNRQVDELLGQLTEIVICCKAHGIELKWVDDPE